MSVPRDFVAEAQERYKSWESSALSSFAAITAVASVSAYLYQPPLIAVVCSSLSGVGMFLSWRVAISGRTGLAGVVAVPSLVLWIAPLVFEVINVKRPVSKLLPLALGLPWLAAALSLCILIARQWKRKE
jgi:hypothetical protein